MAWPGLAASAEFRQLQDQHQDGDEDDDGRDRRDHDLGEGHACRHRVSRQSRLYLHTLTTDRRTARLNAPARLRSR
jgi:hypothetical protein